MPEARLEVTDVLGRRIVTIEKEPFLIGRQAGSDLHLPSAEVSRDHAEIVSEADGFVIRDRGSRYGTFINDKSIERQQTLAHGDRIRLGRTGGAEIVFLSPGDDRPTERGVGAIGDLKQVAALLEGLRALSSARVLDDVLTLVMDSAIEVGGAERGFIMLANEDDELEFTTARSRDGTTLPGSGFETSRKIPEEVFRTGKARVEADLLDGDLANQHMGTIALGIRNVLCVPLRLVRYADQDTAPSQDRRVGVLYLDSREKGTLLSVPTTSVLETLANEAAVAIENAKLYRAALEKAKLDQEMQTAADIQQALLPTQNRTGVFFDVAAEMLPCRSIGGDFFDYIDLPDGVFGFALGDVAGKGPPAALLGAMLQGSLTAQAYVSQGPAATMAAVNTALVRRGIQGRFVTLFYAVLFPDGRLTYCNAGHNPPMLVAQNSEVRRLEEGGMVLGLFDGTPFEEETVTLGPGDFLVAFSDGVSEALDPAGEEFGDDGLLASIASMRESAVEKRLKHVFSSVSEFTAGAAQHDDITAMIVGYRGSNGG